MILSCKFVGYSPFLNFEKEGGRAGFEGLRSEVRSRRLNDLWPCLEHVKHLRSLFLSVQKVDMCPACPQA